MGTVFLENLCAALLCGAGLMLALLLLHTTERRVSRLVAQRLGWRGVYLTGWLGVPVHELAHLLTAKVFRHRVIAWKLFDPDPVTGTLGYVRHAHSRRNLWQIHGNFFIGIAPLLAGSSLLAALLWWMLPADAILKLAADLASLMRQAPALMHGPSSLCEGLYRLARDGGAAIWHNRTPWLPLQLYLSICVACHLAPSLSDLRASLAGALLTAVLVAAMVATVSVLQLSLAPVALALLVTLFLLCATTILFSGSYACCVALLTR